MALDCRSFWGGLFGLPDVPVPSASSSRDGGNPGGAGAGEGGATPPLIPTGDAQTSSLTAAAAEAADASENAVDCTTGDCPKCEIITGAMLANVYNEATAAQRDIAATELNWFITEGGLDSELRLAHFLGQTRQETAGHILRTENLNYSIEVLKSKFGYYGSNPAKADAHGRGAKQAADQEAIANHAYADRIGNGNIASGDGWTYRGRGIKQLTGRGNYKTFTTEHKTIWGEDKNFVTDPALLSSNAKYAVRSGLWFWSKHNLGKKADKGQTRAAANAISSVVNLYDGADGFAKRYNNMKAILKAGTFKNVCFNKTRATRNSAAKQPFGDAKK